MTNFQIGHKVVYIIKGKASMYDELPVVGKIYTIRNLKLFSIGKGIVLEEIINEPQRWKNGIYELYFRIERFYPLTEERWHLYTTWDKRILINGLT